MSANSDDRIIPAPAPATNTPRPSFSPKRWADTRTRPRIASFSWGMVVWPEPRR
jgi:hypothetical protein